MKRYRCGKVDKAASGLPMRRVFRQMRRVAAERTGVTLLWVAAIGMLTAPSAWAGGGTAIARARMVTIPLKAYARVESVALVRVKAGRAGFLTGLGTVPGEMVKEGAVLGRLVGPPVDALLADRKSEVVSAGGEVAATREVLDLERKKLAEHLSTLKEVYRAEAALTSAQARLDNARSRLAALKASLVVRAPAEGRVLSTEAASGERVAPGQTILTLQPSGGLWLVADFFGADAGAVRAGMTGRFEAAGGGQAVPVKVRTIIGATRPDGATAVGLVSTRSTPGWRRGEMGSVTLDGAKRAMVEVPTRALILDRAQWWVLVRTREGNRPQVVVPSGVADGGSTLIERGLAPGTEVLVENAYLEFHRGISERFQASD